MQKKIKSYINASISTSIAFIVAGLLAIIFPHALLDVIRWIISIFCLVAGIYLIVSDFSRQMVFSIFSTTTLGAIMLIIGMIFAMNEDIMSFFSIVIGAWFVITSIASLKFASTLRGYYGYGMSTISAILSLLCGVVLILNPWAGSEIMMSIIGVFMVIYSVSNFIDMSILKRNVIEIARTMDKSKAKKTTKDTAAKKVSVAKKAKIVKKKKA